jgi:hypothetical protein
MSLEFPEYSRSTTIQCALPDPALGVVGWKTTGASFFVPTTARGNRRNRPIDLGSLCPDSANRVHVKFGRRFRHVRPFIAAGILCMSKVAVLFDMHPHAVSCSSASRGAGTCWRDVGRGDWVAGWQHARCDDKRAHVGCQTPPMSQSYAVVGADRTVEGDVLDVLAETTRRGLFPEGETPMLGFTDGARCPLFDACCPCSALVVAE